MPLTREQFDELHRQGLSPEQIAAFERGERPEDKVAEPGGVDWRRRVLAALPSIGGGVGGALGGAAGAAAGGIGAVPGALVGAGVGGAGGKALEMAGLQMMGLEGGPKTLGEASGRIGAEGLMQAGMEAGGGLLAKGVERSARPLMERALRIGPLGAGKVTPRMLRERATTAIQHRIPVGGRDVLGSEKAIAAAQVSGKELNRLLDQAEKAGAKILPDDIAEPLIALYDDITHQPLSAGDKKSIMQMTKQFLKEHPGPMTPKAVKLLKQRAQQLALPIIKNRQVRPGTNARDAIEGRFNDAIATGARRALENMQTPMPGAAASRTFGQAIGGREGITSNLLDLADATRRAEGATSRVTFSPFGPLRLFGATTPAIRLSRPTVSQLALGASHPGVLQGVRQTPRSIEALLNMLLMDKAQTENPGGSQ